MDDLTIIKLNAERQERWRYTGRTLRKLANGVLLEAHFNHTDILFHGMVMRENDRFVELYLTDRWYNIYEVHAKEDDSLRGWYCNVARPAEVQDGQITFVDLALDLLVFPDGRQLTLDEDEFSELNLPEEDCKQALAALEELKRIFSSPVRLERDFANFGG